MSKHCEPVDYEQIVVYGIRVIPDREVLESVTEACAVSISNKEIQATLEKTLERFNR